MATNTVETIQMKVSGMMCSFCTMSIERALKRYPGVKSIMVNLAHSIRAWSKPTGAISGGEELTARSSVTTEVSHEDRKHR